MVTQKKALSVIKQGGQICNAILLDSQGVPQGQLTTKQIKALLGKGLSQTTLYDQTTVIK